MSKKTEEVKIKSYSRSCKYKHNFNNRKNDAIPFFYFLAFPTSLFKSLIVKVLHFS